MSKKVYIWAGIKFIGIINAFDTVGHDKVLLKMPLLGFSQEVIDWYKS